MKSKSAAREAANTSILTAALAKRGAALFKSEGVFVELPVPKRALDVLPGAGGLWKIKSASICSESDINLRKDQWDSYHIAGTEVVPPTKTNLEEMLREPLDSRIRVFYKDREWDRIERLAVLLKITPAEWLLAGVGFNLHNKEECA